VGDHVAIAREVLAELGYGATGLPPAWICIPPGMRGRVIGWRDDARVIIDLSDADRRLVIFVGESNVTLVRGHKRSGPSLPEMQAAPEVHAEPPRPRRSRVRRPHRARHR
jgi:hypothetical protein